MPGVQTMTRIPGWHTPSSLQHQPLMWRHATLTACLICTVLALLLAVLAWATPWLGLSPAAQPRRLELAAVFALASLTGAALTRLKRPRLGAGSMLACAIVGLAWVAHVSGLGLHMPGLSAAAIIVTLTMALAGLRAGLLLCALQVTALLLLHQSTTPAASAVTVTSQTPTELLIVQLTLMLGSLVAGGLIHHLMAHRLTLALRDQERLADWTRVANDWYWEADADLRITYVSPSFAQSGRDVEAFMRIGQPGGPHFIEDEHWAAMREDLLGRRAFRDRLHGVRWPDGRVDWVRASAEPRYDEAGHCLGWRGVSHDVTAEHEAQRAQARTGAMLEQVFRVSPGAICVARLTDGRMLYVNPGFETLTGYEHTQAVGKSAMELGMWTEPGEPARLRDEILTHGSVRSFRTLVRLADERWADVRISAAGFEIEGDQLIVMYSDDLTELERVRVEGDAILDNASVGIALMRGEHIVRMNPHWLGIFGDDRLRLADGAMPLPNADQIAKHPLAFERDLLRADGRRITVQFNTRRMPQTAADAHSFSSFQHSAEPLNIWVAVDVTARHQQAQELSIAKHQAEAASAAKGAFLATMSHEIRTPLNGVLGMARLLRQMPPEDTRRDEFLGHLCTAAESLNELVSNVLDLSKIEAGALHIEDAEFDLHQLIHKTFEGSAVLGRERGLQMACLLAPGVPQMVRGDALRVRQILSNFLTNAVKFTEHGSVNLEVASGVGSQVRFSVRDSGCGVPAEHQGHLFEPFSQADASTTRRFGGTGLGLSICRELATRMGGRIGMESDGRTGSRFWVELPLPALDPAATEPPARERYPLAGKRVLVAEDNPVNMVIITSMLQRLGAEVLPAEDGAQAVHVARQQAARIDAVLMDLHMPLIDGLRATRLLRADAATATLPIHAYTAAALEHERQAAKDAGMQGFLTKPVMEADLVRLLRQ